MIIENSKRECALNYLGNLAHKLTAILSWPSLKLRIFYKTYCYIVDSLSFSSCSHHLHHHDDDKIFVSALIRFGLFYLLNYCGTLEPIIIRLIIIISSCRCFFSLFWVRILEPTLIGMNGVAMEYVFSLFGIGFEKGVAIHSTFRNEMRALCEMYL